MSVTAEEAKALIVKAQAEGTRKFYEEHPQYLRGRTVDEIVASYYEQDEPDWSEGVEDGSVVDGHIISLVKHFGGEGQGEVTYVVYSVDDQLFRKDGYYASDYGTDWDGDWREVQAVQKQVTFYE